MEDRLDYQSGCVCISEISWALRVPGADDVRYQILLRTGQIRGQSVRAWHGRDNDQKQEHHECAHVTNPFVIRVRV